MNVPAILKELTKLGIVALTEKSVETFVETKIKPIFENWGKQESRSIELEECLSEYLLRCYGKNNIMTTIVFGRLQKTLEDLYIPLTLEEYRNEDKQWVIDENCYDILDNYSRILIVDMAGMGKSTIVKYFACQGINLDKSIPIVIELRKLEKNQAILEYIQKQINSYDKNIEVSEIVDILKKGDFVIFFDGYDEITNENKPDVLEEIQEFTSKASNTKIVITSREEDDLNSLGEFKCVNIKPLTEEEAYKLIEKYDSNGEISKKLIKRIKEDSSMDVLKEFLENPLLVSLLYKTFEYKEEIPYKKIDFYEQVYAALFNDHDKTKGSAYVHEKKTKLDRFQFEQILRTFGFLSLKTDKVEYSSQLMHQLLKQSIERYGWLKISVDDFLYDITHAVPFIQKDGNEYKWIHKSFMEYFASCFICFDNKESEERYLKKMIYRNNSLKYRNVLDFCFELDTLGFRKYAILPYLQNYKIHYENCFKHKSFKCINQNIINKAKNILSLDFKVNFTFFDCSTNEGRLGYREKLNKLMEMRKNGIFSYFGFSEWEKEIYLVYDFQVNKVLYDIISKNIPEVFDKDMKIESCSEIKIPYNVEFKLDDDIGNYINTNEELFTATICMFSDIIFNNIILNYQRCNNLINEIVLENSISNNEIFDL